MSGPRGEPLRREWLGAQWRSEVAEMRWPEIDLAAKVWTLPASRAKNGRQHSIPLSDAALDVLHSLCPAFETGGTNTPVFQPVGFSQSKAKLDAALTPAVSATFTLHDLRRRVASGMARLGVQPHVIEACLNHKSGTVRGVAQTYIRYNYAAEKRNALGLWGEQVERLMAAEGVPIAA